MQFFPLFKIAKPNEELSGWFDQPKTYDNHNDYLQNHLSSPSYCLYCLRA